MEQQVAEETEVGEEESGRNTEGIGSHKDSARIANERPGLIRLPLR